MRPTGRPPSADNIRTAEGEFDGQALAGEKRLARGGGGMFPRSHRTEAVGYAMVSDSDEMTRTRSVVHHEQFMARRAGGQVARATGKAAAGTGRKVLHGAQKVALGSEEADRRKANRDTKRQAKKAKKAKKAKSQKKAIRRRQATGRVHQAVTRAGHSAANQDGPSELAANNKTTQYTISATSRVAGTANKAGRAGTRFAYRKVAKPATRFVWSRAGRPAMSALSRGAATAARVAARAAAASAAAVKATVAAALSSTVGIAAIAIILVLSLITSIVNILGIENDRREKEAAALQAGMVDCGKNRFPIPAKAKPWVAEAAKTSGLPGAYVATIMNIESSFNPGEASPMGYAGLLQIGTDEWREVGGPPGRLFNPMDNAHYGGLVLKKRAGEVKAIQKKHPEIANAPFGELLAVAHNAGPGRVANWTQGGEKLPAETQGYLVKLRKWYKPDDKGCQASGSVLPASASADRKAWYALMSSHGFTPGDPSIVPDVFSFYWGECTSFVAWALYTHGTPAVRGKFNNFWRGHRFGNAMFWDSAARAGGVPVDRTPAVGAVAQRTSGQYGHVAYIVKVHPDKSFDIEEGNHGKRHHTFGTRSHVRIGREFTNVLHFEKV